MRSAIRLLVVSCALLLFSGPVHADVYEEMSDAAAWMGSDFYTALGLAPNATQSDVKKAYRAIGLKLHPDKVKPEEKEAAEARFVKVRDAYEVLKNETLRVRYDRVRARFGGPVQADVWVVLFTVTVVFVSLFSVLQKTNYDQERKRQLASDDYKRGLREAKKAGTSDALKAFHAEQDAKKRGWADTLVVRLPLLPFTIMNELAVAGPRRRQEAAAKAAAARAAEDSEAAAFAAQREAKAARRAAERQAAREKEAQRDRELEAAAADAARREWLDEAGDKELAALAQKFPGTALGEAAAAGKKLPIMKLLKSDADAKQLLDELLGREGEAAAEARRSQREAEEEAAAAAEEEELERIRKLQDEDGDAVQAVRGGSAGGAGGDGGDGDFEENGDVELDEEAEREEAEARKAKKNKQKEKKSKGKNKGGGAAGDNGDDDELEKAKAEIKAKQKAKIEADKKKKKEKMEAAKKAKANKKKG